jgi:AcrR family transcriptional regulator
MVTKGEERPYHHGNLRRTLLDGALHLFAERGGVDFTLRELARAAGVTHNAPYRHFASKAELLAALRSEGLELLAGAARSAVAGADPSPQARVQALGEAYVRFALEHPHHFRLVLSTEAERGGAGSLAFEMLQAALDDGRASGAARNDLTARELALVAWALVHGLASLLAAGQLPTSESSLRRYVKLCSTVFFDGAGPRPRR